MFKSKATLNRENHARLLRKIAAQTGKYYYFTNLPCRKGHFAERLVSSNKCVSCQAEKNKRSAQNSPSKRRYYQALRGARLVQATPSWVDFNELDMVYKSCPKGFVVDHIVTLVNDKVCGLNVPWNLQYLTAKANCRKSNKF